MTVVMMMMMTMMMMMMTTMMTAMVMTMMTMTMMHHLDHHHHHHHHHQHLHDHIASRYVPLLTFPTIQTPSCKSHEPKSTSSAPLVQPSPAEPLKAHVNANHSEPQRKGQNEFVTCVHIYLGAAYMYVWIICHIKKMFIS